MIVMGIDISQLSEAAQRQILEKLNMQKAAKQIAQKIKDESKPTKYRSVATESRGIKFDSKKEARRYEELILLLRAGEISDLRLQHNITLIEGYTDADGIRVKPMVYKADFTYFDKSGKWIVEDTKSEITRKNRVYLNKKKLLKDKRGITIIEV